MIYKMSNLITKFLSFVFIVIITFFANSCSTNKQIVILPKIYLDETGVVNFIRYLNGTFHEEGDMFSDKAKQIMGPMYYAVSENGKVGYGWFCRSYISSDCRGVSPAYQLTEYCKKHSKSNCFIFAEGNKIVWNDINIIVTDLSFSKNVELFKKLNLYNLNSSKKVNEGNYLNYVSQISDNCSSLNVTKDYKNFRGATLECLLPGHHEWTHNDLFGSEYNN
jgi:hypothetical protein